MSNNAQRALKGYLWFVAIFHLGVGLALNVSDGLTRIIAAGYGATVDWTPQFTYILHPLGAFMIALGFLAAVAARDPQRYEAVIFAFVGLFAIRALHRVVFGAIITAFRISPSRNTASMLLVGAQAILLLILWRAARRPHPAPAE